jgi:hypothetical protein
MGGRANQRRAGKPPGTDRYRRHRSASGSAMSFGCDATTMPWRSSEAKNPAGENRALIDGSSAEGQSPTYVTRIESPYTSRR